MGDLLYSKTVCHYYGLCLAVKARPVHGKYGISLRGGMWKTPVGHVVLLVQHI